MRCWIDTDIGDNPDDTVALWCAVRHPDVDLVGVSTVDGDVARRAELARALVPRDVDVVAGPPPPDRVASADTLVGIGPWTHVAALGAHRALPPRVVLMGGALGPVHHRGAVQRIEHNVGRDPEAARRLLGATGGLVVVPLDATAAVRCDEHDEAVLLAAVPRLGDQLEAWREEHGPHPLVLHDPVALLVAVGEPVARVETRRLEVDPDGTVRASIHGLLQHVVAHVDAVAARARVRALVG